jgi:arylsulfatase A-like enzyme
MSCPDKIKPGTVSNDLIMNIDFAPTLLDFAQLKSSEAMQGKSFKSSFADTNTTFRESVYYHYYEYPIWHKVQPHYGIRTERYKLIHFYYSMDEWELYDLENDPQEMNNIYKNASDSLIKKLKAQLTAQQRKLKDDGSLEEMKLMTDTVITRVYNEPNKVKNK